MPEQEKRDSDTPISEPRILCTEVTPGYLSATFGCQHPTCSSLAAAVELIIKGTSHPDDQLLHREILEGGLPAGFGQVILKGFLQDHRIGRVTNWSQPLSVTGYQQVAAALRSKDLETLYALDRDYAPFYCPRCPGVFCALHYRLEEVWDEAGLDYWHGTCPYGHGKFVDH